MARIDIKDLAKELGLEKHTKVDMFRNNERADETQKMIFTPDNYTHIIIDYVKNRILFYNTLSHLYYRFDIPETPNEIKKLKRTLLALIISLVEERNTFVRYEPSDKILKIFR